MSSSYFSAIRRRDVARLIEMFSTARVENDILVWITPAWLIQLEEYTRRRDA